MPALRRLGAVWVVTLEGGNGDSEGKGAPSSEPETDTEAPANDTSSRSEPDLSVEAPENVTVDKLENR